MATPTKTKPAPSSASIKEITEPDEHEAQAAVEEAGRIIAGDPPPSQRNERFTCARCFARFSSHGYVHQPGNGNPVQPLCPKCSYLFFIALRHCSHNTAAAVDICNAEGVGHLEY